MMMAKHEIMTVAGFKQLLQSFENEITEDFHVWLSSDEEGNQILPMLRNIEISIGVDLQKKRVILFPAHH